VAPEIRCKRIYAGVDAGDGIRVLVERLWPRGVRKADAAIDLWLKDIAPSAELRRWFGHDPSRWDAFQTRYRNELDANPRPVADLLRLAEEQDLTLVYSARDEPGNSAQVLRDYLGACLHGN
jgi:uncharacterized protein YeaO (DUF488 family)